MTAEEIRKHNIDFPNAEQYTKAEHQKAEGFNAWEAMIWNRDLTHAEQYTKAEHMSAKGFNAWEAMIWNRFLTQAEQYTIEEIIKIRIEKP